MSRQIYGVCCLILIVCTGACSVEYPACRTDKHCESQGEFCVDSRCVKCRRKSDCGGNLCIVCESNQCERISGCCTVDLDCPGGKCWLDPDKRTGRCGANCRSNADCGSSEECKEGACIARPNCKTDADCGPSQRCQGGNCVDKNNSRGKRKRKARQPTAWKRTRKGTVISRVSVGDKRYLELRKMRVTVRVDGPRVRTVIDHIYFNPFKRQLEGRFRYTLPVEASISYYAMFVGAQNRRPPRFFSGKTPPLRRLVTLAPGKVAALYPKQDWGTLREARLVPAGKGRRVYETITRRRIDPALVEAVAPNTFSARVFPVPAQGYNRVIIAYEQTLPELRGQQVYRFSFPADKAEKLDFSLVYNAGTSRLARHNLNPKQCQRSSNELRCSFKQFKAASDAVLYFKPRRSDASWVAGRDPIEKRNYLYARLRAKLPVISSGATAGQAIFLLDTSFSENPDRFAASVMLLKQILVRNRSLKRFNLLLFDVSARWLSPGGWIDNTPSARQRLFRRLDRLLLEGATNIAAALSTVARPRWLKKRGLPLDLFLLSDGQASWGDTQSDRALGQFRRYSRWGPTRFFAYRLGLGSENLSFLQKFVRAGGALFSCLGLSELPRCATAHTRQGFLLERVTINGIGASDTLIAGRQSVIYPGAVVTLAARFARNGLATIRLHGRYRGRAHTLRWRIPVRSTNDLAPRAWAELAVAQLLELNDPTLKPLIVAYSQHFHLTNRYCSLLVLETDREYKQYGLNERRKKAHVDDLAGFLNKAWSRLRAPAHPRDRWLRLLGLKKRVVQRSQLALKAFLERQKPHLFTLPPVKPTKIMTWEGVPKPYLTNRGKDRNDFGPFVQEALRRIQGGKPAEAVRALSTIIEQHPGDSRAARLVAYYLMAWNRPVQAARLFLDVLEKRSHEPHSYRDLARAMIKLKRHALAAALYEVVLSRTWSRFPRFAVVAREEYALMISRLDRVGELKRGSPLRSFLAARGASLGLRVARSRLRVTVTWNTDNTDVDLWVLEPGGEKCSFRRRRTTTGGDLLQDVTRGYGPERYQNIGGPKGAYQIKLKFYGNYGNVLGNETHVSVLIVLDAGGPGQRVIEKTLVLKKAKAAIHAATVKLP